MNQIGDVMRLTVPVEWHDIDGNFADRKSYVPGETFLYSAAGIATHLKSGMKIPLSDRRITQGHFFRRCLEINKGINHRNNTICSWRIVSSSRIYRMVYVRRKWKFIGSNTLFCWINLDLFG